MTTHDCKLLNNTRDDHTSRFQLNISSEQYSETTLLDYDRLRKRLIAEHEEYTSADPFPHLVVDNFLSPEITDALIEGFPAASADINWRQLIARGNDGEKVQFNKQGMPHLFKIPALARQLIWELNSGTFIRCLEKLTGIDNLLPDPSLRGGGLHQILPGGLLGVHADFTHHVDYDLERRVNLLLYLNKDWQDEYEGHLELWNQDASQCVKRLRPSAGRCIIFNTDADSYHGHPRPLNCPEGMSRKSIALYYYTVGRDDKDVAPTQRTDWQKLPETELPTLQ
ncbi:MAG: 2OG-Fe(II) oxygenase [Halieaceae bacterium]